MKAYILTDKDFDKLLIILQQAGTFGDGFGGSQPPSAQLAAERDAVKNRCVEIVKKWIGEVQD